MALLASAAVSPSWTAPVPEPPNALVLFPAFTVPFRTNSPPENVLVPLTFRVPKPTLVREAAPVPLIMPARLRLWNLRQDEPMKEPSFGDRKELPYKSGGLDLV